MATETREEREARDRRETVREAYQIFGARLMGLPSVHTVGYDHEKVTVEVYRRSDFFEESFAHVCDDLARWCKDRRRPMVSVEVRQKGNEHRANREKRRA